MRYKAVLFDMDGVLVLSESAHYEAWTMIFKEINVDPISAEAVIGRTDMAIAQELVSKNHVPFTADDLCGKKVEIFLKLSKKGLPVAEDRDKFLNMNYPQTKMAVVSSSTRMEIGMVLEESKIANFFRFFIGFEDTDLHKPDPEPYLKAMDMIGSLPDEVLIIEDSPSGIAAGKSAGAHVVGLNTSGILDEKYGVKVFNDFHEIIKFLDLDGKQVMSY